MCVGKRDSQIRYLFFLTHHKSRQSGKTTFFHWSWALEKRDLQAMGQLPVS